jgi:hypothetical protein
MRKFVIVAAGLALLGYASYRPAASPAPPATTATVAALPNAQALPPRTAPPAPHQESAQLVHATTPLDVAPTAQQQSTRIPPQAPAPSPAKRTAEMLTAAAIAA